MQKMHLKNEDVSEVIKIIRHRAERFAQQHPLSNLDSDEFFSIGLLALMQYAQRYDPNGGASFKTWTQKGASWAMIDALRSEDILGRHERDRRKRDPHCLDKLSSERKSNFGMRPSASHQYHSIRDDSRGNMESIPSKDQSISRFEAHRALVRLTQGLPARTMTIIVNHYFKEVLDTDTAKELGLTVSRVVQLKKAAEAHMRKVAEEIGLDMSTVLS